MSDDDIDADGANEDRGSLTKKIIASMVFGVIVFATLSAYGDVNALGDELRSFQWWTFGVALLLATANYLLRFVRWTYYLKRLAIDVPLGESLTVFVAGFVMSITPGKVGEVFKSVLLFESRGISIARTAPIVIAERLTDLFALVLLTAVGCLAFERGVPVAVGGFVLVAIGWGLLSSRPIAERVLRWLESRAWLARIAPKLREAYESLTELIGVRAMLVSSSIAVGSWFLECAALWYLALGFDSAIGWLAAIFGYSAPTIIGAVAMLPGGLGLTEAGMTGVLTTVGGVAAAPAAGMTILCRLATLWWAVALGIVALIVHRVRYRG